MALFSGKGSFRAWIKPYLKAIKIDIQEEVSVLQAQINDIQGGPAEYDIYYVPTIQPEMYIEKRDKRQGFIAGFHLFTPIAVNQNEYFLVHYADNTKKRIKFK